MQLLMMELSSAFSVQSACASQRSLRLRLRTREEAAGGCRTHIRGIRNRCGSSSCRASGTSGSSIARPRRLRQSHHRPGSGLVLVEVQCPWAGVIGSRFARTGGARLALSVKGYTRPRLRVAPAAGAIAPAVRQCLGLRGGAARRRCRRWWRWLWRRRAEAVVAWHN